MSNKELRAKIEDYLKAEGLERERIYRTYIHPFFEGLINGVMGSLKIAEFERPDFEDLKQEARLKLLTVILNEETMKKIHNIRSYCFMTVRNAIVDGIRKQNTFTKYIELIENFYESEDEETL